eukprot:gene26162-11889_t
MATPTTAGYSRVQVNSRVQGNSRELGIVDDRGIELGIVDDGDAVQLRRILVSELGIVDDGDVVQLRRMLVSVVQDNKELVVTLEGSVKQVEALQGQDDARVSELQIAYESTEAMRQEIRRLQAELTAHLLHGPEDEEQRLKDLVAIEMQTAVAQRDAKLTTAVSEAKAAEAEVKALKEKVTSLAQQIAEARQASAAAAAAAPAAVPQFSGLDLDPNSLEGDVQLLYAQLREEVGATNSLLEQAEEMVIHSRARAAVGNLPMGSPGPSISREHELELVAAKQKLADSTEEARKLREMVRLVEVSIGDKDKELRQILESACKGSDPKVRELALRIGELSAENSILQTASAYQDQHVGQARKFLQAKIQSFSDRVSLEKPVAQRALSDKL